MTYPTEEQIKEADITTLCRWTRFLPSPGEKAAGEWKWIESAGYRR